MSLTLCQRRRRPGRRRVVDDIVVLDRRGHHVIRGRRRHVRRLDRPRRTRGQRANPNDWIAGTAADVPPPVGEIVAGRSPASRRSSRSWPTSSAATRSRRRAGSSTTSDGARLRAREPDPPDLLARSSSTTRSAGDSSSSTSSPTSGSATPRRRAVAAHLAQRGLRHLRRVAVERARRPRHRPGDLRRFYARHPGRRPVLDAHDRRPGPGPAVRHRRLLPGRDDAARAAAGRGRRRLLPAPADWARRTRGGNVTTDAVHRPRRADLGRGARRVLRRRGCSRRRSRRSSTAPRCVCRPPRSCASCPRSTGSPSGPARYRLCGAARAAPHGQTSARSRPTASATSARLRTPSLPNSPLMWLSTVFSERNSSAAISLFVRPSATRSATSRSRPLSPPRPSPPGARRRRAPVLRRAGAARGRPRRAAARRRSRRALIRRARAGGWRRRRPRRGPRACGRARPG